MKNGFRWPTPTKSGLLSHEFFVSGVYFFSDHSYNEAAEYIGTIIVRPKQVEHFVEISADGFQPGNVYSKISKIYANGLHPIIYVYKKQLSSSLLLFSNLCQENYTVSWF